MAALLASVLVHEESPEQQNQYQVGHLLVPLLLSGCFTVLALSFACFPCVSVGIQCRLAVLLETGAHCLLSYILAPDNRQHS